METEKISKLAIKLSLPMIISMISMAIYNIVDTVFVSKISSNALIAVSLSFPIQVLISAVGLGIGIGVNSFLAKAVGAKKEEKARSIISNAMMIGLISYFAIILLVNRNVLLNFFTHFTDNEDVIQLGITYINIIILFSICNIFQNIFNKILEAYGKTKQSMIGQFCGIIVNIILDPILIFGVNGFCELGIKGAAIATILGRTSGIVVGVILIIRTKEILLPKLKEFKIEKDIISNICKVGVPVILTESAAPIITAVLNNILISFSADAVSFYGIYYKVQSFIFLIISGLNYGMIPIIAHNIGAKNQERVKETIKWFLIAAVIVTSIGTVVFAAFPNLVLGIFEINEDIMEIGTNALRILCMGFIFAGESFVISGIFQAKGDGKVSLLILWMRKIIVPFLFIFCFKNKLGLNSIWYGFTVAEVITFVIAMILLKSYKKKMYNI